MCNGPFILIISHCSSVIVILCTFYCLKDIELLTDEIQLPLDRPLCGFYDELCPQDNSGNCCKFIHSFIHSFI